MKPGSKLKNFYCKILSFFHSSNAVLGETLHLPPKKRSSDFCTAETKFVLHRKQNKKAVKNYPKSHKSCKQSHLKSRKNCKQSAGELSRAGVCGRAGAVLFIPIARFCDFNKTSLYAIETSRRNLAYNEFAYNESNVKPK
jgi:hypothetical protein